MSFLTGQDRTLKFAGQVLPDRTESGLIFLTFYLTSMGYQFSYYKVPGHKFGVKNLNWEVFFFYFKSVKSPAPGKENVRFPDFLKICRTSGPDVMSGRALANWLANCNQILIIPTLSLPSYFMDDPNCNYM